MCYFYTDSIISLIKMLYWMCEKTDMPPTGPQLIHAIKRNFGGLEESGLNTEIIFRQVLVRDIDTPPDLSIMKSGVSNTLSNV